MTKTERQQIAAERWRNAGGKGGFNHPTGFGKMYETNHFVIKRMYEKNPDLKVIIVVNSDALRQEWRTKIVEHLGEEIAECVLVETVHFFQRKGIQYECTLLVPDEVSTYFSEDRQNVLNGTWIKKKYCLWLDATPDDRQKRDKEFYQRYPCVDHISKEEALLHNWVTKNVIYNIPIELTENELEAYKKAEDFVDKNFGKLKKNFETVQRCLRGYQETVKDGDTGDWVVQTYNGFEYCTLVAYQCGWRSEYGQYLREGFPEGFGQDLKNQIKDIHTLYGPDKIMGYARATMEGIKQRMTIIYTAENKINAVLELVKKYEGKQIIVFTQRNDLAKKIKDAINLKYGDIAVEHHSNVDSAPLRMNNLGNPTVIGGTEYILYKSGKRKGEPKMFSGKAIRDIGLQHLRDGVATILITGSGLDRGLDTPRVAIGIVCGFTQNPSQHQQRGGRLTRLDVQDANKEATFICLYAKNTKEQGYLLKSQKASDSVKWVDSIDNIDKTVGYDI